METSSELMLAASAVLTERYQTQYFWYYHCLLSMRKITEHYVSSVRVFNYTEHTLDYCDCCT
jgi:hypothetical protein